MPTLRNRVVIFYNSLPCIWTYFTIFSYVGNGKYIIFNFLKMSNWVIMSNWVKMSKWVNKMSKWVNQKIQGPYKCFVPPRGQHSADPLFKVPPLHTSRSVCEDPSVCLALIRPDVSRKEEL